MKNPNISTNVVHSQSKSAWNVVGDNLGCKFKIARIPYITSEDTTINNKNLIEAFEHAKFISYCFNHSDDILKNIDLINNK